MAEDHIRRAGQNGGVSAGEGEKESGRKRALAKGTKMRKSR